MKTGDIITRKTNDNKVRYMVIDTDEVFGVVQMINSVGRLIEDLTENCVVIGTIDLSVLG